MMHVSSCPHPWDWQRVDIAVNPGTTCEGIVAAAQPDPELWQFTEVIIGDRVVDPHWWPYVRPKPGTIVTVNTLPAGGGALRVALGIGVLILAAVATYFAGPAGAGLGSVGAGLVGGGVAVVGTLGITFLLPQQDLKITEDATRDSPTYSFGQGRNVFRPGGPVPMLFGKFRFAAPKIGEYTEVVGSGQYIRILLLLSTGLVTDPLIQIGESDIGNFSGVRKEFKRGWHPDILTEKGSWSAATGVFPASPSFGDRWVVSTTATISGTKYRVDDSIIRNHIGDGTEPDGWDLNHDKTHKLFPSDVFTDSFNIFLDHQSAITRTTQVDADEIAITISFPALFRVRSSDGDITNQGVQFKIEYSPAGAGTWTTVGTPFVNGRQQTPLFWSTRWDVNRDDDPDGQFDVRVTRLSDTEHSGDDQVFDSASWTSLQTFTAEGSFGENVGFSTLALRVKATGQLSGTLDTVQTECQSIERDWTGSEWKWKPTSTPGAHFRHVLQHPSRFSGAAADSRIDLERLAEWSEADNAAGREFNGYIDYATNEYQILQDIAASGFASPMIRGTQHAVTIDEPKTTPVRLFSPKNTSNFQSQMVFPVLPHAFRVTYLNAAKGYIADEIIVYADGYDKTNARIIEPREYLGLTTQEDNWLRGRRDLAEATLRREVHTLETSIQSIACERGDLVALQHYGLSVGLAAGRVKSVA